MRDQINKGEAQGGDGHGPPKPPRKMRLGLTARLRAYFLAGVLITAPISITLYLAWLLIDFIDTTVSRLLPAKYNPENYLPFSVPGLGVVIVLVTLTLIGALTAGYVGRLFVRVSESILARMPIVRSVYGATKQIFETVFANQSTAFRQVVLVEYPRRGTWALGFITGKTVGEVQNLTEDDVVNVFLPTTPNPTSGFLLFLPRQDIHILDMTVEEGIKMVVSGGIVTPPDRRPRPLREQPVIASRAHEGDAKAAAHAPADSVDGASSGEIDVERMGV